MYASEMCRKVSICYVCSMKITIVLLCKLEGRVCTTIVFTIDACMYLFLGNETMCGIVGTVMVVVAIVVNGIVQYGELEDCILIGVG